MIALLTNHLWQSTLFAIVAGLLSLSFRANRAHVRYWLWFAASAKFLVPFALLTSLGSMLTWAPAAKQMTAPAIASAIQQAAEPFNAEPQPLTRSKRRAANPIPILLLTGWSCGFLAIALIRLRGWLQVESALRSSTRANIAVPIEVRSSEDLIEPGVAGLIRPVLLLPEGIEERLTSDQLAAVLEHELCHVRRRDNLTAAIHMVVEAVFWFHPLVWWVGSRLVEERERACDEEVLRQGGEPQIYAEAILNVCKYYLESPVACVAGISGADLKSRIHAILGNRRLRDLNLAKKIALVTAGIVTVAAPIFVGLLNAPIIRAQSAPKDAPKFEVAAIKPCDANSPQPGVRGGRGGGTPGVGPSPERLNMVCQPLINIIRMAYVRYPDGKVNNDMIEVEGGPSWINNTRYEVEAKAENPVGQMMMRGPMMQALIEDRFKLKMHRESRETPIFELTVAKSGAKLKESEAVCVEFDIDHPPPRGPVQPGVHPCPMIYFGDKGMDLWGTTMRQLAQVFSNRLDRPVVDKTGLQGRFDVHMDITPAEFGVHPPGRPDEPAPPDADPVGAAINGLHPLGLRIDAAKGPRDFLVIDHLERPSDN